MINGGRTGFLFAPLLQGILEGGVPLVVDGEVVVAVGVSGVRPDQGARAAVAALAA
jgi:glc operon protein GlcG